MAQEIALRPWHRRRDRSAIERWPAPELPKHWLASEVEGPRQSWAIDVAGQLSGRITLSQFDPLGLSAWLGIYLRPDLYGQGIGQAALRQFLAIAPVEYLRLAVAADNDRAIKCYRKVGFQSYRYEFKDSPIAYLLMSRQVHASDRAISNSRSVGSVH